MICLGYNKTGITKNYKYEIEHNNIIIYQTMNTKLVSHSWCKQEPLEADLRGWACIIRFLFKSFNPR